MINPLKLIKVLFICSRLKHDAIKEITMDNASKPGWKTTEFWMTVLTQVPTVLGIFIGVSNPITIAVGAAATIAYTLSRAWSKTNGAAVALAALDAAAKASKELPVPEKPAVQ